MSGTCPGCVGRGRGSSCCMCGNPIPAHLQLSDDRQASGDYVEVPAIDLPRRDCSQCRTGAPHSHR